MLIYTKLWLLLEKKGMKRTDLKTIISGNTLAKLGKNENVSSEVIGKICDFLNCQPGDIMENITKEDKIRIAETVNETVNEMWKQMSAITGMSPEAMLDEFVKQIPEMKKAIKTGDYIGIDNIKKDPAE